MTVSNLSGNLNDQKALVAALDAREPGSSNGIAGDPDATRIRDAARDFEAVLLRQMLSALERTTQVSHRGSAMAGQQTYGSMVVEAVADAVASAGGIGLANLITGTLTANQNRLPASESRSELGTESGVGRRRTQDEAGLSDAAGSAVTRPPRNSSQGFTPHAVPKTEIRTTSSHATGQLADRRFR